MYSDFRIKGIYRTKKDNIDTDLIIPLIRKAKKYDRGTGFFGIAALSNLADGLIPFLKNNGKQSRIRIITSVELSPEDRAIIQRGEELAKNKAIDEIQRKIEQNLSDDIVSLNMDLITNLIATKMLEIRIAFLRDGGIYHEKIGIFEDFDGEKVCFIGSQNETYSGYKKNVESVSTLRSWREGDLEDIEEQEKYFNALWEGNDEDIEVIEFPEAQKQNLFKKYKYSMDVEHAVKRIEESLTSNVYFRKKKALYDYQKQAIEEFENNCFCHFYEMATGTGKTFTAVKSIEKIAEKEGSLYILILVPQVDLQIQWEKELNEEGRECYLFGGISKENDWKDALNRSIIDYYTDDEPVIAICIYDTYFLKIYKEIEKAKLNVFIIVDEAHELSSNQIRKLPDSIQYRLGLSATPERHNENETKDILKYFTRGTVSPFEYTIDEAIKNEFLSRYEYYPIIVNLTEEEFEIYKRYTQQLIVLYNQEERDQDAIKDKLQARGIIVKKAKNKVEKIKNMIESGYDFTNSVVYCGQGKDFDEDEKIIDIVSKILNDEGNYLVSQFTSKTENRKLVLAEFERGYYDTLVAIKCFDQGVDVPKLDKIYIMASDSLMRQTIQRRGRVLRQCKETGKTMAYIYDMVAIPPEGIFNGVGCSALVRNELKRVEEYMRLAENKKDCEKRVEELKVIYDITEEDVIDE